MNLLDEFDKKLKTIVWESNPANEGSQELIYSDKNKVNLIIRNQRRQKTGSIKYKITIEEIK